MPIILFYLFAILMIAGGVCVVALKNPVSSAMGMIGSFIGIAALLIGLNAYFVGTLQVLVYAGAIMVLFIFIIMLLDLKSEARKEFNNSSIAGGIILALLFVLIMLPVLQSVKTDFTKIDGTILVKASETIPTTELAKDSNTRGLLRGEKDFTKAPNTKTATLPDVNLIGQKLFTVYNFPLQVVGVLLLVATIGCVALSKKLHGDEPVTDSDTRMAKTIAKSSAIPEVNSPPTATTPVTNIEPEKKDTPAEQVEIKIDAEPAATSLPPNAQNDEKRGLIYDSKPDYADDLVIINGVGPVLEDKLNSFGIYTFKQIASWSPENVAEFDDLLSFKGRIERDNWISQASELCANQSI